MFLVIMQMKAVLILGFLWCILLFFQTLNIKLRPFVFRLDLRLISRNYVDFFFKSTQGQECLYSSFNYILCSSESCFNLTSLQSNHFSLMIMIDCSWQLLFAAWKLFGSNYWTDRYNWKVQGTQGKPRKDKWAIHMSQGSLSKSFPNIIIQDYLFNNWTRV